jgi:hypothetical protein
MDALTTTCMTEINTDKTKPSFKSRSFSNSSELSTASSRFAHTYCKSRKERLTDLKSGPDAKEICLCGKEEYQDRKTLVR